MGDFPEGSKRHPSEPMTAGGKCALQCVALNSPPKVPRAEYSGMDDMMGAISAQFGR